MLKVEEHVKTDGFHNPKEMDPKDCKVVDGDEKTSRTGSWTTRTHKTAWSNK